MTILRFSLAAALLIVVLAPSTSAWAETQTITEPYSADSTSTSGVAAAFADRKEGEMRVAAVGFSSASATVVATHNLASEANQVDYTVNFHIDAALVVKGSVGVSVAARHATCESCGGFGASGTLLVPGDYATTLTLRNSTGSAVPPGNIDLSVELIGSAAGDTIGISRPCTLQPHCVPQEIIRVPTPGYASGAGTLKSIVADAATTSPGENSSPQASFTHTCSELTCSFDASGSSDSDGSISSYRWDFGDGTTGSGVTASHSYASAGTYRATLTVTDRKSVV